MVTSVSKASRTIAAAWPRSSEAVSTTVATAVDSFEPTVGLGKSVSLGSIGIPDASKKLLQEIERAQPSELSELMRARCEKLSVGAGPEKYSLPTEAGKHYVLPMQRLVMGQWRLSAELVKKNAELIARQGVDFVVPVTALPDGRFVVHDKNTHLAAMLLLGVTHVRCVVVDVAPASDTLRYLVRHRRYYPFKPGETVAQTVLPQWWQFMDDPYRSVVSQIAVKVRPRYGRDGVSCTPKHTPGMPMAWVKYDITANHAENELADILYRMAATDARLAHDLAHPKKRFAAAHRALFDATQNGTLTAGQCELMRIRVLAP